MATNRKGAVELGLGGAGQGPLSVNPKAGLPLAGAVSGSSQRSASGDNHSSQDSIINGIRLNSGSRRRGDFVARS